MFPCKGIGTHLRKVIITENPFSGEREGVELGFGLRNEKALLMEREWSGGVEQGLGKN